MEYCFDKKFQFGKYSVQIDTAEKYGYFEHEELGDEAAGGLWFARSDRSVPGFAGKLELVDYDGMACLPKAVIEALRENGFIVDEDFE